MINSFFSKQFILFLIVGSSCAAANILARVIFDIRFSYSTSVVLAFCVGFSLAFFLNYKYVFPKATKTIFQQIKNFFLINTFFLPIVWFSSVALQEVFINFAFISYPNLVAHIFAVSIPVLASFLIYKFSIFKE